MIKLNIQRFSSTNKTTHYELSQYVSSDLPTYLVDYNSDMSKIDTGINTAQTTADTASTAATNAQTAAETAQGTANTAVTNAATADGKAVAAQNAIGTLANLTTTVKTDLVSAVNEVNGKNFIETSHSIETNKAYSCDYINNALKEEVIPNSEFKTNRVYVDSNNKEWPIYVYYEKHTMGNTANVINDLDTIANFGILIDCEYQFIDGSYYYPSGSAVDIYIGKGSSNLGKVQEKHADAYWNGKEVDILIEYTKSTD